ncbi:membrane protein DedA with SNARE-associated domain [Actinorugispora endophytica]|uniref:Membrane protein DedA with SNARE-associated domain n=2 Tax=Actinorugispora endophytica TaxID=1605990 RepID=A0A4R6V7M6_9ACTN|nr:membrane protein DedA with SNARE-associated domain [Actinorugispora endophytica]
MDLPFRNLAAPAQSHDGVVGWVVGLMESLGGPGAGLAIALENLFPPIPSEAILPLAGFAASRGELGLVEAIAWTTAGSVVGALALYWIGALLGRDRFRALASRVPLVKVSDVDRTEAWFRRHGAKAVFLGRMIPLFRSFISVPAGIERMPMAVFLAFTALGSLIWNTAFVLAGYLLGESWHLVEQYAGVASKAVVAAVGAAVLCFVAVRLRELWSASSGTGRHRPAETP